MPRKDGTGPIGYGTLEGSGPGDCIGSHAGRYGAGLGIGLRSDFGRRSCFRELYAVGKSKSRIRRELLTEQKRRLELRLDAVNRNLEKL